LAVKKHCAMRKAIFLDKDGTLIEDVPYNCDVNRICLLPGAREGLRRLQAAGYALIVVSNQPGVAHGFFSTDALDHVETTLRALLADEGVQLDGFYYCPHHPDGRLAGYATVCDCRKPFPGLLVQAASDYGVDLQTSWMVGDILHDVEAGRRAGCRTILIDNGHETEWRLGVHRCPHAMAADLASAADIILALERRTASPEMDRMMTRSNGAPYGC
jgi:D-glycero-D-manno-heptose 1,7-bisphosphate phosphatase